MMLNARLFERGQVIDPPYLWAGGERSAFVEPMDILTFSAWVEQDGVERGFAALLEELQRVRQHGFTDAELAREKVTFVARGGKRVQGTGPADVGPLWPRNTWTTFSARYRLPE